MTPELSPLQRAEIELRELRAALALQAQLVGEAYRHLEIYVRAHFVMGTTHEAAPAAGQAYLLLKKALGKEPPPVQLQDGRSPEWTCQICGGDALFCGHKAIDVEALLSAAAPVKENR